MLLFFQYGKKIEVKAEKWGHYYWRNIQGIHYMAL